MLSHNIEKKHDCQKCGLKVATKVLLRKHMKIHSEVIFNCMKCKENFKNRTSYNKHLLVCKKTGEEIKIKDKCGNCKEAIVVLEELMKQFNRRLQQIKNHKC